MITTINQETMRPITQFEASMPVMAPAIQRGMSSGSLAVSLRLPAIISSVRFGSSAIPPHVVPSRGIYGGRMKTGRQGPLPCQLLSSADYFLAFASSAA